MKSTLAYLLLTACLGACGSGTNAPNRAPEGSSCKSLQADATASLGEVVAANTACTQDSDCISVGFGASCFDSCTRAIAASGKAAYDARVASVNSGACAAYKQQSCPAHIVPPCAPPMPPSCHAGVCE